MIAGPVNLFAERPRYWSVLLGGLLLPLLFILSCAGGGVMCLGDSLLAYHWTDRRPVGVVCEAIPGQMAEEIVRRLPGLLTTDADVVLLLAGENDIAKGRTKEATVECLRVIIENFTKISQVYVLTLPGVNFSVHGIVTPTIEEADWINAMLAPICRASGAVLVDIRPRVRCGNELSPLLTYDGIHFNDAGMDILDDVYNEIWEGR